MKRSFMNKEKYADSLRGESNLTAGELKSQHLEDYVPCGRIFTPEEWLEFKVTCPDMVSLLKSQEIQQKENWDEIMKIYREVLYKTYND